jgi:DNA mismatch repair protein MutL
MGHIRLLSDILASQVAAGEVVERPASVVKELIENSIDAGARRITVEFQRGGTRLIRVTDDGRGMDRSDALLCLERHATSKIRESADLESIETLGFRGEALPSIASISRFRLSTREQKAVVGTEIVVQGGKVLGVNDSGEAQGTRIEVADLFYNVPARRKFLRSEQTEASNLLQQIEMLAVAHPEIAFTCRRDEQEILRLAATDNLAVRLRDLHGEEFLNTLIPVPLLEEAGVRVHGWIARPGEGRSDRNLQMLFVNGRMIRSPILSLPLREACDGMLAKGLHPPAVLFFLLPSSEVDCNVHPAKREVRFRNPALIRRVALLAAQSAWEKAAPSGMSSGFTGTSPMTGFQHWKPHPIAEQREFASSSESEIIEMSARVAEGPSAELVPLDRPFTQTAARYLGQLARRYLLFEDQESLLLVEIRAARERMLYEKFLVRLKTQQLESQHLLLPEVLEMSAAELAWIDAHNTLLKTVGLNAESFGSKTLKVDAIPADASHLSVKEIVTQLVDDLRTMEEAPSLDARGREALSAAVSRLAAAGARLPDSETAAQRMLRDLLACDLPYATPQGRPTMTQLSPGELQRKFLA